MKFIFLLVFLVLHSAKPISYSTKAKIEIEEPSDICFDPVSEHFIVVSDEGTIKIMDKSFNTLKTLRFRGSDFEAVSIVDSFFYVSNESAKQILQFDINTYVNVATYDIHNFGALNEGIEGLTYNPNKKQFIAAYEKNPVSLIILNENFQQVKRVNLSMFSDISSLAFYNGFLYVLSDEDASISILDPNSFTVLKTIYLNIISPEGISFLEDGSFVVVSDAEQKLYTFSNSTL